MAERIRSVVEANADNLVADLHVWHVSPKNISVIMTVVTHFPKAPDHYKSLVSDYIGDAHMTVEVQKCETEPCLVGQQNKT
ncbi:MAG: hypothetical protein ABFR35_01560 [Thermodesulfobacteriota bacterium]